MAELRRNPLLGDRVMIASHRQGRPQMPKDYCPNALRSRSAMRAITTTRPATVYFVTCWTRN